MGAFKKRVAILGSGFPTQITIPALRAENWDVRALFSRNPDRAKQIAGRVACFMVGNGRSECYGQIVGFGAIDQLLTPM